MDAFPINLKLKDMDSAMLILALASLHDSERVQHAASMAAFLHRNQTRFIRRGLPVVPYVEHPLRVAIRLILLRQVATGSWLALMPDDEFEDLIIAALLHDVVEDCAEELIRLYGLASERPFECITRLFSRDVADMVTLITNEPGQSRDAYLGKVVKLSLLALTSRLHLKALYIKASDLKDNAGSLRHQLGFGDDDRMRRRGHKYLPVLPYVIDGLDDATFKEQLRKVVIVLASMQVAG